MKQRHTVKALLIVGAVLASSACSGVQEQFSLTSEPPDEFRVVTRAPLAIPPDYALRPPQPGQTRPQEGTATEQARIAVFRVTDDGTPNLDEVMPADGRTTGERALLMMAGADQADPEIRQIVSRENRDFNENDSYLYDVLVFWRDETPQGKIIDADAEAKRLRENAALGKSVTAGETPTIERKKKALLEGIF